MQSGGINSSQQWRHHWQQSAAGDVSIYKQLAASAVGSCSLLILSIKIISINPPKIINIPCERREHWREFVEMNPSDHIPVQEKQKHLHRLNVSFWGSASDIYDINWALLFQFQYFFKAVLFTAFRTLSATTKQVERNNNHPDTFSGSTVVSAPAVFTKLPPGCSVS